MKRSVLSYSTVLLLLAILLLVNAVSSATLGRFYLDLTDEKLYSLSEGTKKIITTIKDPIRLRLYFSKTDSAELPGMKLYGERVLNLLREYERQSGGMLVLEVYDPRPDSEDAEWAQKYGLTPVPTGGGNSLFLGVVGLSGAGKELSIPVLDHRRQEFLEYDVTKLVYSLSVNKKPAIAVLSSIAINGAAAASPIAPPTPPWFFANQLAEVGDVQYLGPDIESVPEGISLLTIVHPKGLTDKTLKAVDRYVTKGGNLLVFVDPFCQSDQPVVDPSNPAPAFDVDKSSSLNSLLAKWGVELIEKKVVADMAMAESVRVPTTGDIAPFPLWLKTSEANVSRADMVTSDLNYVLFPWAGSLKLAPSEGVKVEKLIYTDGNAHLADEREFKFGGGDPVSLARQYDMPGEELVLAARISGKLKSNFVDSDADTADGENFTPISGEASGIANVIVVADVDFLADQFSVVSQSLFGTTVYQLRSDNLILALNAVENLLGSSDLISLRSRGKFSRDFTKVAELGVKARERWRGEEVQLQAQLDESNQRLAELQSSVKQGPGAKQVIDSALQQEIQNFRQQRSETQRRLRQVRSNLRQELESLGQRLFLVNTFLVPVLLIVLSVIYLRFRRVKRVKK